MPPVRRAGPGRWRALLAWTFMVPLVTVNLLVIVGPAAASVWYAFTDWSGIGAARFVGLANFRELLEDQEFHQATWHYLLWTLFFLTVPITMGLLGAFLLSRIQRFQVLFRVAYFIPFVIASVVNGAIWQNLLDPVLGAGAQLDKLGISVLKDVNFLGNPSLALPTVAFVDNWHWWGFLVVLFLAAMGSVDRSLYEAARGDHLAGVLAHHPAGDPRHPAVRRADDDHLVAARLRLRLHPHPGWAGRRDRADLHLAVQAGVQPQRGRLRRGHGGGDDLGGAGRRRRLPLAAPARVGGVR